ncbi:MFS transporter [Nonomuraea sp. NPDC050310]|uniref:MFS transporter n=1 Tax=Nonomuraea sp. NPDC050310 TaxID=3154935 RepID=UPI0033E208B3
MTAPLLRKVRRRLLPLVIASYVICYIDRTNIGMAQLRMGEEIGLDPAGFGLAAGAFFVGYALCEIPSNLVLHRVGARRWIARIMVTWGLLSGATALVSTPEQLYVVRFLLGMAEAGFFPGVILYFSYWFPQRERARLIAMLMAGIPVSFLVANPVSGWLVEQVSWQAMFVVEALPAVVLGVAVWFVLPDRPAQARWLTEAERAELLADLARETPPERPARAGLLNRRVLAIAFVSSGSVFGAYLLSLFLPQMVEQLWPHAGETGIGLICAIPYGFAVLAMLAWGAHSDRTGDRAGHLLAACLLSAAGFALAGLASAPLLVLAGLVLAAMGKFAAVPITYSLPTEFLSGRAAAAGIALVNSLAHLAAIAGPPVIGWLRQSTGAFSAPLLLAGGYVLLTTVVVAGLGATRPDTVRQITPDVRNSGR